MDRDDMPLYLAREAPKWNKIDTSSVRFGMIRLLEISLVFSEREREPTDKKSLNIFSFKFM
jgi:hypothetical protein